MGEVLWKSVLLLFWFERAHQSFFFPSFLLYFYFQKHKNEDGSYLNFWEIKDVNIVDENTTRPHV